LISDAKLGYAVLFNTGEREGCQGLLPASLRVIVPARETISMRIEHAGGRTVCNMNYTTFVKTRQQRTACANNFVVRMCDDEEHARLRIERTLVNLHGNLFSAFICLYEM